MRLFIFLIFLLPSEVLKSQEMKATDWWDYGITISVFEKLESESEFQTKFSQLVSEECRRGGVFVKGPEPRFKFVEEIIHRPVDLSPAMALNDNFFGTNFLKNYKQPAPVTKLVKVSWLEYKVMCDRREAYTSCCKICDVGYACGNTCISRSKQCHVGSGCACDR